MHYLSRSIVTFGMACLLFTLAALPLQAASARNLSPNTSYVRVIHASPFVGTADVFVDGTKLLSSFQFASITDYVALPEGTHKVQVALLGKGINAALITQDLQVPAGYSFTVAALGESPDKLRLQVFQDDNQLIPNHTKVRIYHLTPDASSLNVNVGGDHNLNDLAYAKASEYVTEDAGPCDFSFNNPQTGVTLPLTKTLTLNTVTSIFAVGLFSGNPKVQLVSSQALGIPGLPGTGSNPFFRSIDSVTEQPLTYWLLTTTALALLGAGFATRRLRQKAR